MQQQYAEPTPVWALSAEQLSTLKAELSAAQAELDSGKLTWVAETRLRARIEDLTRRIGMAEWERKLAQPTVQAQQQNASGAAQREYMPIMAVQARGGCELRAMELSFAERMELLQYAYNEVQRAAK